MDWIVDAYILVFGCLLIPAGALGDRLGRKGVLLAGVGVFAGGCFVAAAAPNVTTLLAGRVTSGVGAALVMPATLSLLLQVTPRARRGSAIATWTAATGAAGALGNLGGGLILQWLPGRVFSSSLPRSRWDSASSLRSSRREGSERMHPLAELVGQLEDLRGERVSDQLSLVAVREAALMRARCSLLIHSTTPAPPDRIEPDQGR